MNRKPRNEQEREGDGRSRRRRRASSGVADYTSVDPSLLLRVVTLVASTGGALRFGYTSDGGAYAVGVYGDGDPYTDYIKPSEDINVYLKDLLDAWE